MNYNVIKTIATGVGGVVWNFVGPALPCAAICTAMVFADCVTAWRLSRRVRRRVKDAPRDVGKLSSRRLGRVPVTLGKVYALLLLSHGVDEAILEGAGVITVGGVDLSLMKVAAGAVCFWQALSILENEASMNGATCARHARRWLIDKAGRHL